MHHVVIQNAEAPPPYDATVVDFGVAQQRQNPTAYHEALLHTSTTKYTLHGTLADLYPHLYQAPIALVDVSEPQAILQHAQGPWRLYTDTPPDDLKSVKDDRGKSCVRSRAEYQASTTTDTVFTDDLRNVNLHDCRGVVQLGTLDDALQCVPCARALCYDNHCFYVVMDGLQETASSDMSVAMAQLQYRVHQTMRDALDIFHFLDAVQVETTEACRAETVR